MSPLRKSTTDDRHAGAPEHSAETLLAELVASDPDVRRRAALALGDIPESLPALAHRVGVETDRVVRDALCSELARYDRPEVVDGLIRHLASDDAGLRNAVAQVLAKTPVSSAARVPGLLRDPDPDVRILTVMLLAGLRLGEVEEWLTDLVRTDPHPNVVSAAIGELITLVGQECEAVLREAGRRFPDDPFIAFSVSQALAALAAGRS